ncbi:uncharacterized protein [Coffea arabica]|uniref:CCHC-type domain-containing protein n=1 Tax=Coffea arabica TaxID=13443 RepID=A0ABM4V300_COFAR
MSDNESIQNYYTKITTIVNEMKTFGEEISDSRIVEKILVSLPPKFDPTVSIIEEPKDISSMSVQELRGSFKAHERRLVRHAEKFVESAFQSKLNFTPKTNERELSCSYQRGGDSQRGGRYGRGRGRGKNSRGRGRNNLQRGLNAENSQSCSYCGKTNYLEKNCWHKDKPKCYYCKRFGHIEKDCRFKTNHQAQFSEDKQGEGNLFYACHITTEVKNNMWYIDSGCSNHMTRDRSIFIDLDKSIKTEVKMGNGVIVQAQGLGTIGVQIRQGMKFIHDVLFVLDLDQNLLSLGQLLEHKYALNFDDYECCIYDKKDG